jgi:hypothetical protein
MSPRQERMIQTFTRNFSGLTAYRVVRLVEKSREHASIQSMTYAAW